MPQADPSRTEQATPKRRNKARDEGNVAKSQELVKAVTNTAAVVALSAFMGVMSTHILEVFRMLFTLSGKFEINDESVYALMTYIANELAVIILPVLFSIGLAAWLCLRLQIGPLWTTKHMAFKWERFNIINGFKNMFASLQTIVRLLRSLGQGLIIALVPLFIIWLERDNFLPLFYQTPEGIIRYLMELGFYIILWTLPPMFIIGGMDMWYTNYEYEENLKMTKQEVKDEHRNAEGDPLIKSKQRQEMFKVIGKRMLKNVPKADVVITNPTHFAVALRYNIQEAPAPIVVAKGADHLARRIKDVAREHNVPIRENVILARALYNSVEVGDMIPEDLYKAVAAILASIWRIKGKLPER